jgi:hypothetical protein
MLRFIIALSCVLCVWAAAIAADPPATAPASQPTIGTLTGSVLNAQGNPAADCIVTLQQANEKMREPLQATTDEKGQFKIEGIPEGEYNLNVRSRDLRQKGVRSVAIFAGKNTNVENLKLRSK